MPKTPNYLNRKSKYSHFETTNHRNIHQYGTLTRGNINTGVDIYFEVLPSGKPKISCYGNMPAFRYSVSSGTSHGYSKFKNYSIRSTSTGRYHISSYPVHIYSEGISSSGLTRFTISPSIVKIKDMTIRARAPYRLVLALTNFHFFGLNFSMTIRNGKVWFNRDHFSIMLNQGKFTFIQDPRIDAIKDVQYSTMEPRITCWLEHNIDSLSAILPTILAADNICDMLSIVTNQNINWVFWRLYNKSGRLVREEYHDRFLGDFKPNNNEIIDNFRIFGGLKEYLEKCYSKFSQIKASYNLPRFKGYLNSTPNTSSVEASLLHLIPGVELIANMVIINSTDPKLNLSANRLKNLNIEHKLNRIYNNYFKFFTQNKWRTIRKDIVHNIRNPLFHSGLISTPVNISFSKTRYLHLIGLQLYLRVIGYKGKYIDFTYNYHKNQRIRSMK